MPRIFLSHSNRDGDDAKRMKLWLSSQGFDNLFLDFDKHAGIPPGADWEKRLYSEIARAHAVILLLTPDWQASKWCWAEYTQARALGKRIFPVVVAPLPQADLLTSIQSVDLTNDRQGGLEQLARELDLVAHGVSTFPWDHSRPPFPGLLAFDESDAAVYFGRVDEIRALIERLDARRTLGGPSLLALLGPSGVGKSSLLRAGLIPSLRRQGRNWIVLPAFRASQSLDGFATALALGLGAGADWRRYREDLRASDSAARLADLACDLRVRHQAQDAQVLITIDQAEELFENGGDAPELLRILAGLLTSDAPYLAVLALRSDYLGQLQRYAQKLSLPFEGVSLMPMPLERVPELITGPARVDGLDVEHGFVVAATRDAGTEDALPLLAFTLRELYERQGKKNRRLTLDDYLQLGDPTAGLNPLERAVGIVADALVTKLDASEELALRRAFVSSMVRINEAGVYGRKPASWGEFGTDVHPLLERFAAARLLTIGEAGGRKVVEVAHEALLRKWPRLRGWLDEDRAFIAWKPRLEESVRDWRLAGEDEATLLSGLALQRAEVWFRQRPESLSEDQGVFILKSLHRAETQRAERQRMLRELFVAHTTTIARLARKLMEAGKPFLAVLAAAESLDRDGTMHDLDDLTLPREVERTAAGIVKQIRGLDFLPLADRSFTQVVVGRSTKLILAIGGVGTLILCSEGKNPLPLQMLGLPPTCAAFNSTESHLVMGFERGEIGVWDTASGARVASLNAMGQAIESVDLDPTARYLFARSDNRVYLWSIPSGDLLGTLEAATNADAVGARIWSSQLTMDARQSLAEFLAELPSTPNGGSLNGQTTGVSVSPNGTRVVTLFDGEVCLWNAGTGHLERRLATSVQRVIDSPDGRLLATLHADSCVRVWDAASGVEAVALKDAAGQVLDIRFVSHPRALVGVTIDNALCVWSTSTGDLLHRLHHDSAPISLAAAPRGDAVAVVTAAGAVHVWDTTRGTLRSRINELSGKTPIQIVSAEFIDEDNALLLKLDSSHLLATMQVDGSWQCYLFNPRRRYDAWISATAVSADRRWLALGYDDATVCVWEAPAFGSPKYIFQHRNVAPDAGICALAFTPDGRSLITAGRDREAKVWDLSSGDQRLNFLGHEMRGPITNMVVNASGTKALTLSAEEGNEGTVGILWDIDTGEVCDWMSDSLLGQRPPAAVLLTCCGTFVTVGEKITVWGHPLLGGTGLLAACRELTVRALTSKEREDLGLRPSAPAWQQQLWPHTDVVALFTEGMNVGLAGPFRQLTLELSSSLERLERQARVAGSPQLHIFAGAIFDAYSDHMWKRLERLEPFARDPSVLFQLVAEQFGETLAFVVERGDRAGARTMLEGYKGPVGAWHEAMRAELSKE